MNKPLYPSSFYLSLSPLHALPLFINSYHHNVFRISLLLVVFLVLYAPSLSGFAPPFLSIGHIPCVSFVMISIISSSFVVLVHICQPTVFSKHIFQLNPSSFSCESHQYEFVHMQIVQGYGVYF